MNIWHEVLFAMGLIVMRRLHEDSDCSWLTAAAARTTSSALAFMLSRVLLIR